MEHSSEALQKIPNLKNYTKKLPAVVYMQGYKSLKLGNKIRKMGYRGWISILAPNHTHQR